MEDKGTRGLHPWVLDLTLGDILERGVDPNFANSLRAELIAFAASSGDYESLGLNDDLRLLGEQLIRAGEMLVRETKHWRRLHRVG